MCILYFPQKTILYIYSYIYNCLLGKIYIKLKIIKQTKVSHSCDKSLFLEYDSLFEVSIREQRALPIGPYIKSQNINCMLVSPKSNISLLQVLYPACPVRLHVKWENPTVHTSPRPRGPHQL